MLVRPRRARNTARTFSGDERTVTDGPFVETKELVAGFTIIRVTSKEEAIEWVKRAPNIFPNGEAEIEIRKLMAWERARWCSCAG